MKKNLKPGDLCIVSEFTYNINGYTQTDSYAIILYKNHIVQSKNRDALKYERYSCFINNKILNYSSRHIKLID